MAIKSQAWRLIRQAILNGRLTYIDERAKSVLARKKIEHRIHLQQKIESRLTGLERRRSCPIIIQALVGARVQLEEYNLLAAAPVQTMRRQPLEKAQVLVKGIKCLQVGHILFQRRMLLSRQIRRRLSMMHRHLANSVHL